MKKLIATLSLLTSLSAFATTIQVDLENIDSLVLTDGSELLVEELISYTDSSNLLTIDSSTVQTIRFSNGHDIVMRGGDMGGGGIR